MVGGNYDLVVHPKMTIGYTRESFLIFARDMTTLVNIGIESRVNFEESTMISILRDLVMTNPPIFLGSNLGENLQEFPVGVYKVLSPIVVTFREKVKLYSYQL